MGDAVAVQQRFPGLPVTGWYAGGEIGPEARGERTYTQGGVDSGTPRASMAGGASLQGFTLVLGIFSAPKRQAMTNLRVLETNDFTEEEIVARYCQNRVRRRKGAMA